MQLWNIADKYLCSYNDISILLYIKRFTRHMFFPTCGFPRHLQLRSNVRLHDLGLMVNQSCNGTKWQKYQKSANNNGHFEVTWLRRKSVKIAINGEEAMYGFVKGLYLFWYAFFTFKYKKFILIKLKFFWNVRDFNLLRHITT